MGGFFWRFLYVFFFFKKNRLVVVVVVVTWASFFLVFLWGGTDPRSPGGEEEEEGLGRLTCAGLKVFVPGKLAPWGGQIYTHIYTHIHTYTYTKTYTKIPRVESTQGLTEFCVCDTVPPRGSFINTSLEGSRNI